MDNRSDHLTLHISRQFNTELDDLRNGLLAMGGQVERQVSDAVDALVYSDSRLAYEVSEKDTEINFMELSIDDECTRILARRHPAASDLRLVIACTKAATDLERIGDEAAKIARLAVQLCEEGEAARGYNEISQLGSHVCQMVRDVLNAFARFDANMALAVAKEDQSVDKEYKKANEALIAYMKEHPQSIGQLLNIVWALRSLERIGDHARNIAEYVIYLVKGIDVRHQALKRVKKELFKTNINQ